MKGLNMFLAAILLIAITIVVASLVMNWITELTTSQGRVIENKTAECSVVSYTIQDVYVDISTNTSRVTVRNSGFATDQLESAAVFNTRGESTTNLTEFPITINQGDLVTINLNISNVITVCPGNFSKAIVSSKCTSASFSTSPKCA